MIELLKHAWGKRVPSVNFFQLRIFYGFISERFQLLKTFAIFVNSLFPFLITESRTKITTDRNISDSKEIVEENSFWQPFYLAYFIAT